MKTKIVYEVGDRVRVLKAQPQYDGHKKWVGLICTVSQVSHYVQIRHPLFQDPSGWHGDLTGYLELVNKGGEMSNNQYKMGDIVSADLIDMSKMLPAGELDKSKYKAGDLFVTTRADDDFGQYKVIQLYADDRSDCPKYADGYERHYMYNHCLIPISALRNTNEGEKPMGRRTFKLIKDTPAIKKGALFQEECEDGTQPYIFITPESRKGESSDAVMRFQDRSLVEGQPEWFEEVYKVDPEYLNAADTTRWEDFKKTLGKRTYTKKTKAVTGAPKKKTGYKWTPAMRKAQSERMKARHAANKR